MTRPHTLAALATWLACALCLQLASAKVYEVKDARMCNGFEKAFAKCEGLPSCTKECEPRHCTFATWGEWYDAGGCSGLCHRHRRISEKNNECGTPCVGPQVESKKCEKVDCLLAAEDCTLSVWSDWSDCTSTVDQKYRFRVVLSKPTGLGAPCSGNLNETAPCDTRMPIDCEFSEWGQWTECSASCDGGYHAAMRRVTQPAKHGGLACQGSLRKTQPCNDQPCSAVQKDCAVGEWSEWVGCNFASPQQRYRTRDVKDPAIGGGKPCSDVMKQTVGCEREPPQDCTFTDWSAWGQCDRECGGGQMYRKRQLATHPENGGSCNMLTNLSQTAPCNNHACHIPKACAVSLWSEWTGCSASCDSGMRQRSRELMFGEEAARRLSILDMFADKVVQAQNAPALEDCTAGFSGDLKMVEPCTLQACERKGCEWGLWTEWSPCTSSCAGGTTRRSRAVARPAEIGGTPCDPADMSQIQVCNTQACETCVDGAWGEWTEWSSCSATCDSGFRSRHRDVSQHPNHCGKHVGGVGDEFERCNATAPCVADADCQLGEWTEWTSCSNECYGVTERHRNILTHPSGKGKACQTEALKEMEPCNPGMGGTPPAHCKGAKLPCQMAEWGDWGACSASCGDGQRMRMRHILSPATEGGELCNSSVSETRPCSGLACPVHECLDCRYGDWSSWGACSKCGGQRYRHRSIEQMPNDCGRPCDTEETKQAGECLSECEEEKWCAWSDWTLFGDCSAECGPATKSRQRRLTLFTEKPLDFLFSGTSGVTCEGTQQDTVPCELHSCKQCEAVDCALGDWSEWSSPSCSQLCERSRTVMSSSKCGGQSCVGPLEETKYCEKTCYKPQDCLLSLWGAWSECANPQDQRYRKRAIEQEAAQGGEPCQGGLSETQTCSSPGLPMPCQLSNWESWSECTKTCLGGLKKRTRAVRSAAVNGGQPCDGAMEELTICGAGSCGGEKKDCLVGAWGGWTACNHEGQRSRARSVEEPANGGEPCSAAMEEIQECSRASDCKLSDWSEWDTCDKTCAGGQQGRQRQVVQNPHSGGKACEPNLVETRGCNEEPCNKVDCVVSDWSLWTECSASCGPGQRGRSRKVLQEPSDGGLGCGLELSQVDACLQAQCDYVDCLWSDWSDWGNCNCPCDGGQRSRTRSIVREPQRGGQPCVPLSKEEVSPCNTQKCGEERCVDGLWGEWSEWEKCSKSCKGGVTWRSRSVATEANHCGQPATGSSRVYASCNEDVACEESIDCEFAAWGDWSTCNSNCDGVRRRARAVAVHGRGAGNFCIGAMKETSPCNPVPGMLPPDECAGGLKEDCQVGEWAAWEACSASCNGGSQARHRQLLTEPRNGGACAEVLSEVQGCARGPCSGACEPQDCVWDDWGEWSACDKCGGQMRRFRHIRQEAGCGGAACEALASEETKNCTRQCHEPVYCMWGDWENWGDCSATCGTAEKSRTRRLQVTSDLPVISEFDISAGNVDENVLQERVRGLQLAATGMKTRRVQELILAFACGGVSLVMGFAVVRIVARNVGTRKEFTRLELHAQQ